MRRKLDETRRSHRLKEQALRLQGSLLTGVAAAAAGGAVAGRVDDGDRARDERAAALDGREAVAAGQGL